MQDAALAHIIAKTAYHFGVAMREMYQDIRRPDVVTARLTAYFACHHLTGAANYDIGRQLDRDASTISFGVSRAQERYRDDEEYRAKVDQLFAGCRYDLQCAEKAFLDCLSARRAAVIYPGLSYNGGASQQPRMSA